ncbi:uncharacterized protein LOC132279432 [Cornus florida]|uniref:uncharacterized protein LOC132279432 n=1 Tax=Cornus florida TaxID=4283 RepID=UPI00289C80A2|nr:uncharacterized protein LOC132279432 [Cornus florida]
MESDDDYQSFSPPDQISPPAEHRKLKRLKKKAIRVSNDPLPQSVDEALSMPPVDSYESQGMDSSETLGSEGHNEPLRSESPSEGFDEGNELNSALDGLFSEEDRKRTNRALDFDDMVDGFDGKELGMDEKIADLKMERTEKKRVNEEGSNEKEEKKKRSESPSESFDEGNELNSALDGLFSDDDRKKTNRALDFDDMVDGFDGKELDEGGGMDEILADLKKERAEKKRLNEEGSNEKKERKKKRVESVGDDTKTKRSNSNKRREDKERRAHLNQLHADSQRLLRETRDAGFKPVPVVTKPISSILEKIRRRKLELSKKFVVLSNNSSIAENHVSSREVMMDAKAEDVSIDDPKSDQFGNPVQEDTIACHVDVDCSLDVPQMDGPKESAMHSSHENDLSQMALDNEECTQAFRAPIDDTQDLFCDSQTSESKDELPDDQQASPLEELLAPSLPAMNLKFDSAPPDGISSDEEDNDKENVDPGPHRLENRCSSPNGDPVKAFVDDEAVEEDDSDNDLFRFQENEEDQDNEDLDELNDMIATQFEEKPTDNEKRNELHQKWLEQQDAAGTDNLLQILNCGLKQKDAILLEEEEEDDEDEEEFSDEVADDLVPTNIPQMNSRKAKQMISQMFSDKDDAYLSSDEEETEKKLVKQRLLDRAEEQATFLSPAEDESSREVFGLIKKLNIAPDTKRKTKASSFFDTLSAGGNSSSSSKSSFLGRASSHSFPSSHKQGTSKVRSFIFGRDDSNSRSSISISEDSSDTIPSENRSTRNVTAKFSSSQSKSSTQSKKIAAETVSGTSLFEILKRSSSLQSNPCNQDSMVGLTQTVFASFKIPKKPIKVEGRI